MIETLSKEIWPVDLTENELDIHSSKIHKYINSSRQFSHLLKIRNPYSFDKHPRKAF